MKKFSIVSLTVLVLAIVWPRPAAAGFGLKGGWSQSKINYSVSGPELSTRKAFTGGVFWNFNLGLFSIQPEILYVPMGARQVIGSDWQESRFDYIQVPVLVKVNIIPGPVSPMIYAGPYGAFVVSAKYVSYIDGTSFSENIGDQVKSTDFGFVFGGGLDLKLAVIKLSAEVRYNLGMANISQNPPEGFSAKNESLVFLVGVGF